MAISLRRLLLPGACVLVVTACGADRDSPPDTTAVNGVEYLIQEAVTDKSEGNVAGVVAEATNRSPVWEEAAMMAKALAVENQALLARLEEQAALVADLEAQLAEALVRLDGVRMELPAKAVPAGLEGAGETVVVVDDLSRVRVLDVNRDQQVAVVSGGQRAGMKAGMRFYVLREDKMIASLRLIDVREQVAGGLIEQVEKNVFPEKGDRLILSSKQDG